MSAADLSRCVFASGNRGKFREVSRVLRDAGIELVPQAELGVPAIAETGTSFVANALLKARHAARASGLPAIADDSGLSVEALDGRPGVRSARYAGPDASDRDNIDRLLAELDGVPKARRGAAFRCAVVLVTPDERDEPLIAEAEWRGRILDRPRGSGGFGYDPLFYDEELGRTAAELGEDQKNAVSHRGKALRRLAERLTQRAGARAQ